VPGGMTWVISPLVAVDAQELISATLVAGFTGA
jgi:hypothetical protein